MYYKFIKLLLLFLSLITIAEAGYSMTSSSGTWNGINIQYSDSSKFIYSLQFENRSDFDIPRTNEFLIRPVIGYSVTKNFDIWLGYDLSLPHNVTSATRQTIWEQAQIVFNVKHVRFALRTRLEQRYNNQFSGMSSRLRERILINFNPVSDKGISPIIYDEIFLNLNHPIWVSNKILSQNRAFIGLNVLFNKKLGILLGYLNRLNINSNNKHMQNILFVSLNLRLGGGVTQEEELTLE